MAQSRNGAVEGEGEGTSVKFYPEEEIASLVRSLDRPEDNRLFSEDVVLTYPHLASAYVKVCPRRCDLATAARNALDGAYSYEPDLAQLKEDVRLMVSNCVRFNGNDNPLSATAQDFERFAMEQIRRYLEGKSGGRRTSSLRFLQSATSAAASHQQSGSASRGGGGGPHGAHQRGDTAVPAASPPTSSDGGKAREKDESFSRRELVQLVGSLVRREDADAFVVDVAAVYPELREAYEAACPRKMNLNTMKQRAQSGLYTQGPPPAVGATVADCLPLLREDVELVVGNCIRFNAQVEAWVTLARNFQSFAHRRIDDAVLRKLPHLRGTETGAQRYTRPPATTSGSGGSTADAVGGRATAEESAASGRNEDSAPSPAPLKRPREEEAADASGTGVVTAARRQSLHRSLSTSTTPASVQVVPEVPPSVKPTPLQPTLVIPARLRVRLLKDYLEQESVPLRLVGETMPASEVVVVAMQQQQQQQPAAEQDGARGSGNEEKAGAKAGEEKEQPKRSSAPAAAARSPPLLLRDGEVRISERMSAQWVLRAFQRSVAAFFLAQRSRPDFADPFSFSAQEEASYLRVVEVMEAQFESLLPHALLYEREAAELRHYAAQQALRRAVATSTTRQRAASGGPGEQSDKNSDDDDDPTATTHWSAKVHYSYLTRFLVQFPQIASLAVATSNAGDSAALPRRTGATASGSRGQGGGGATGGLRITKEAVTVMQYVTKIVQECLLFIADYEDALVREVEQGGA